MSKGKIEELEFRVFGDQRGSLVSLEEASSAIPFEIKRVYYIYGTTPGLARGKHAHYNLKQVLVCVAGSCDVETFDGKNRRTFHLDNPARGLLIEDMIWHHMENFSSDCVLMVLASDHYREADYVRDYNVFLKEVSECSQK